MAMLHAVACGLSLNELCQITFTPLLKSDSYYCADPKTKIPSFAEHEADFDSNDHERSTRMPGAGKTLHS